MTDVSQIDPEIRALLDEVIADPRSRLLQRPTGTLSSLLAVREERVSAGSLALTQLERHLVQWGREELADLLDQASRVLTDGGRILYATAPSVPPDWRTRLERRGPPGHDPEVSLLRRSLETPGVVVASDLARASLRVLPSDKTRIQYGLALQLEGRSEWALEIFDDVLSHPASPRDRLDAEVSVGFVMAGLGRFEEARERYRSAALTPGARPLAVLEWLIFAMRAGDVSESQDAVHRGRDSMSGDERDVAGVIRSLETDMREGYWSPSRESPRAVRAVKESAWDIGRRLADVVSSGK